MMTPASVNFIRRLRKLIATCSLLKALPTTTCAICVDDFNCQDELLRLPNCRHIFHRNCILPWFSRNNTCPFCRQVFPVEQPKRYAVPLRTHLCPWHPSNDTHVFHLHFHIRPLPPWNSDYPHSSPPTGPLEEMLVAEGYPQLATRACGPFWVSVNRNQQSDAGRITSSPQASDFIDGTSMFNVSSEVDLIPSSLVDTAKSSSLLACYPSHDISPPSFPLSQLFSSLLPPFSLLL
ncbi:hypothetical protein L1887_29563 [Cichorium endivia]|nr:hypothetical protein L1887_29563 [Cichorium endivia]